MKILVWWPVTDRQTHTHTYTDTETETETKRRRETHRDRERTQEEKDVNQLCHLGTLKAHVLLRYAMVLTRVRHSGLASQIVGIYSLWVGTPIVKSQFCIEMACQLPDELCDL